MPEMKILLDFGCLCLSFLTMLYIYRLRRLIKGNVVLLLLVGFIINVVLRFGYLFGYNMHPYFISSYAFVACGLIALYWQVMKVIHSPLSKIEMTFKQAQKVYRKAEEAHYKAEEAHKKSKEAFEAAGEVLQEARAAYQGTK